MKLALSETNISYHLRNWDTSLKERPILLLHSALSTHKEFEKIIAFYENRKLILLDFPGHGESTSNHSNMTTRFLGQTVRSLLEELSIYSVDIIGYSLGGYVALELARMAPSMVNSIVSHAMKFYWTPEAISEALSQLDCDRMQTRSKRGFDILSEIHRTVGIENTILTMRRVINHFMLEQLHELELQQIKSPLLISVGDRDDLIPLEEITRLYTSQESKMTALAIHPDSPHSIAKLDLNSFTYAVREFWKMVG